MRSDRAEAVRRRKGCGSLRDGRLLPATGASRAALAPAAAHRVWLSDWRAQPRARLRSGARGGAGRGGGDCAAATAAPEALKRAAGLPGWRLGTGAEKWGESDVRPESQITLPQGPLMLSELD
jgi:hypothetical protein